jgi:hypothetical protein
MKHLKQASETLAKMPLKHLKTITNICNIQMKHLQNIRTKHLKTLENICLQHACIYNIQIYFCNVQIKHLQHMSGTAETFRTYT